MTTRPSTALEPRRAPLSLPLALGLAFLVLAACTTARRDVSTGMQSVEQVTAQPASGVAVTDLRVEPTENSAFVNVAGTIVNQGSAPVSGVKVRIDVMDSAEQVIDSVVTPPVAQTIAANGGQAPFTQRMSSVHLVHYRAIAITR